MLSSWGVVFKAIDLEKNPAAAADLEPFGITLAPALIDGDRAFHGWDPRSLAEFLGIRYVESESLPPHELAERLDRVLDAAERALRQLPAEHINRSMPERRRTLRELGYHIFRLALAYRDALVSGRYPEAWLLETPSAELASGPAIADYGGRVMATLRSWWKEPRAYEGVIETYYGRQTAHELLERTAWHAAQHLRQLYSVLGQIGVTLSNPLSDDDFRGLPLPKELW